REKNSANVSAVQVNRRTFSTGCYDQGHAVFTLLENWGIPPERIRITAAGSSLANESSNSAVPPERIEVFITDVFSSEYVGVRKL
ncbi:MAG: hypothetical protein O2945_07525, partial [Planctomycetota bacterium]|nr:hypothetical protein [Planctomycetota bacterium]MDA0918902.1 hypothetical protein [Planctomycetota bacterium]